ncbi:MAG: BofC C-terminal domain-containing protein [Clostridia bacterium]|nr:BofC C-terminal domain-containing protein [Clostridia bacterium]
MPQTTDKRAKRREWIPAVIACSLLIGSAMWVGALLPLGPSEEAPTQRGGALNGTTATTAVTSSYARMLKEWDGQVALFIAGESEPLTVYEVDVRTLPEEEQRLLKDGVAVNSEEELAAILENYTS